MRSDGFDRAGATVPASASGCERTVSGVQVGVDLRRGRARDGTIVGLAILVLAASPFAALAHGPSVGGASAADHGWSSATAASVTAPSALSATASTAVTPAAGVFQPNCYKIDTTVCVSILNSTETNIIPPSGSFVSTQQPNASSDITLAIKSHTKLDWPNALHSGPLSPIALNVTARLWNGDPFYSVDDGTVWHANGPTWWTALPQDTSNLTYPYWYTVTFNAHGSGGAPNFFPGMTVSWWIYLTYNSSTNGGYTHHLSPMFQFTYSGAWPYSPYPGSGQYVGSGATFEDINLTVSPRNPNFNDSVQLVLNTTQADVLSNATIGTGTYVDVTEVASNGTPIAASTFLFPVLVTNGFGAVSTTVAIPASYSQVEGAIVTYTLSVRDVSNDLLVTPPASYTVGGNGSFLSGIFPDDLDLATTPQALLAEPVGAVQVAPGAPVNLTLTSRNAGTSISAAEAVYTLSYPLLHETILLRAPLTRVTSTQFIGSIPGMPLGSFVNFSVYAWDFSQRLEISPELGYYTPDLQTEVPVVPGNASFFYVFVYDNGSGAWVSGA